MFQEWCYFSGCPAFFLLFFGPLLDLVSSFTSQELLDSLFTNPFGIPAIDKQSKHSFGSPALLFTLMATQP